MKKEKFLNIILQMPYILFVMIFCFLIVLGQSINLLIAIPSMLLLFFSGYGLSRNNKTWNIIAVISIIIFTIFWSIMGYYDSIKWFSTKIAIVIMLFYSTIIFIKKWR